MPKSEFDRIYSEVGNYGDSNYGDSALNFPSALPPLFCFGVPLNAF